MAKVLELKNKKCVSQMAAFTAEVEIVTAARYETPSRFWDQQ